MPDTPDAAPVRAADRIASIDVLRGVAVLGILLLNVNDFSMVRSAYLAPTLGVGPFAGADFAVWAVGRFVGDQRFMSIFAMLFGAGVVLSNRRADAREAADPSAMAGVFHARRMAGLLAIGLVHAYGLWSGDVLVAYAVLGMLVYPLRRHATPVLVWVAGGLITLGGVAGVANAVMLYADGLNPPAGQTGEPVATPHAESRAERARREATGEVATLRGPFAGQFAGRAAEAFASEVYTILFYGPRVAGLMVLGMALLKAGMLDSGSPPLPSLVLAVTGLTVGSFLAVFDLRLWASHGYSVDWANTGALQVNYWSSAFTALGYVGLVVPACRALPTLVAGPLAAVGRTALSNYLLQTLAGLAVFNGVGLGLFGRVDRVGQLGFVLAVWGVQVPASVVWLRHFRFGPVEWAWRSATYGAWQPMRR